VVVLVSIKAGLGSDLATLVNVIRKEQLPSTGLFKKRGKYGKKIFYSICGLERPLTGTKHEVVIMGLLGWIFGGGSDEDDMRECPNCDGDGTIRGFIFNKTCSRCNGTGEVIKRKRY